MSDKSCNCVLLAVCLLFVCVTRCFVCLCYLLSVCLKDLELKTLPAILVFKDGTAFKFRGELSP